MSTLVPSFMTASARTLLAASAAAFVALAPASAQAAGEQAPDFTLRDINNQEVSLSDYRGKVVLVSFWATWCGPCKVEMPHLDKLDAELEDRGFEVLSISTDDARAASTVKPYIKKNGYQFTVLLDKTTTVVSKYNPAKTLPYTAIIDREGRIAHVHMGYNQGDEVKIKEEVVALLGPAAAAPEGP